LLNAKECDESDFYIAVAKKFQQLEPSPLAAWSIANWYVKKTQCANAVDYYLEAFALADSLPDEEKNPFKIKASLRAGYCYLSNGSYAKAKLMANRVLSIESNNGEAYMILGDAYLGGATTWGENDCQKKAGYWAAVDKYQIAAAKDPSLKDKIGPKIGRAKSRYPKKEDCFFHSLNEGSSITIGGWINETVTVRFT
jgi:tetratricopeptide (TPR) repeat protein